MILQMFAVQCTLYTELLWYGLLVLKGVPRDLRFMVSFPCISFPSVQDLIIFYIKALLTYL
jgi:hypothetical protein